MSWQRRAVTAGEQFEPIVEPRCKCFHAERRGARGSQLDCERDAVHASCDPPNECRTVGGEREARIGRACARNEQLHRTVTQQLVLILRAFGRHAEGRDTIDVLTRCAQRFAAGRQDAGHRVSTQQHFGHSGGSRDHMLAVVEYQQPLLRPESRRDPLGRQRALGERHSQRGGHRDRDQIGIRQRPELRQRRTVGKARAHVMGDFEAQARLADPTRTQQRDQAVCDHQIGYLADLCIPADQLGDRLRKIALRCRQSRTRRCRGRTDFARELIASPCNGAYEVAVGRKRLTHR